jgi:hypothetical protein
MGENIYFGDIKELFIKDDYLSFTTYSKDKYILSDFSNLFDSFLKDFLRVRNQYLADTLFMKTGMLLREYEGHTEITNAHERNISKGKTKIQFYEGSILFIPELKECFSVSYNFMLHHEFDEDEYVLRIFLENGQIITVSKLGTSYEDVRETMESILGKMYEKLLANYIEALPGFDAKTILKIVQKAKEGRFIKFSSLKKIHEDLPLKIDETIYGENSKIKKIGLYLKSLAGDDNFYFSLAFSRKSEKDDLHKHCWLLAALPEKNLIILENISNPAKNDCYCFKIIMQQGIAQEKMASKILEIEQSMMLFHFDMDAIYKDRKELRKSKYRNAIKKLSFVRLLRKSFITKFTDSDPEKFKKELDSVERKGLEMDGLNKQPSAVIKPSEK